MTSIFLYVILKIKKMGVRSTTGLFLKRLWKKIQDDRCFERASGLSSTTFIALVPVLALLFSLFSAFGSFKGILKEVQASLVKQFLPASQEVITTYINKFIDNTQALGVIGLFFFLITAVFLFNSIQNNFTEIWGSRMKPFSWHRIATYVSILIVGSFLLSIGLNFTEMLRSLIGFPRGMDIGEYFPFLLKIVPLIILFFAFLVLIILLPGDRVYLKSGLIGAAAGTILWEVARKIFFFLTRYVIKLSVIYGSLAAIPLLLLWLYTTWVIVLLSLEITYVHQYWKTTWFLKSPEEMSSKEKILLGLEVYLCIARRFFTEAKPATRLEISDSIHISLADISFFIDNFYNEGLVLFTGKYDRGIVPSKSLDKIALIDIIMCLFGKTVDSLKVGKETFKIYSRIMDSVKSVVGNMSVMDYLNAEENIRKDKEKGRINNILGPKAQDSRKINLSGVWRWINIKSSFKKIKDRFKS